MTSAQGIPQGSPLSVQLFSIAFIQIHNIITRYNFVDYCKRSNIWIFYLHLHFYSKSAITIEFDKLKIFSLSICNNVSLKRNGKKPAGLNQDFFIILKSGYLPRLITLILPQLLLNIVLVQIAQIKFSNILVTKTNERRAKDLTI